MYELEGLRSHLDRALSFSRWEGLAGRRRAFVGAEDGIDEEASFREGPLKALHGRRNTVFGRYACILSGGTWTGDRHSSAGFDVDPCCFVCRDTRETPIHRWWVLPRWDVLRGPEGLAILGGATDWQPRCLWECGLLPTPAHRDGPPATPNEAECGKPRQRRFPGKNLFYTDAPAMRPKDPYLRRAACAFWAGDSKSDSVAWSLPGPFQTVYHAELFAILVALEVFRWEVEIVSDCKGVVDETERVRAGGRVSPTSRHADLCVRYRDALSAEGFSRVYVRWVPSHRKEGSDRISPGGRNGNDQADKLANAQAKRIGPAASQGKLYDRRAWQLAAIQGIQLRIFTASQASDPPRAQDQAPRGAHAARGCGRAPPCARKCHLPTLECGN